MATETSSSTAATAKGASMSTSSPQTSTRTSDGLPLLKHIDAGPLSSKEEWASRLKEEFRTLIEYQKQQKLEEQDWFTVKPVGKDYVKWEGKCWMFVQAVKYQFTFHFEIPSSYPTAPFDIVIPELDGKTVKMYKGGKICLSDHFFPLWARNAPRFGVVHGIALGLGPWLATEIPLLAGQGKLDEDGSNH